MISAAIFNAILCVGVLAMVIAPLVWAILTQHRDRPELAPRQRTVAQATHRREHRQATRPQYRPLADRA